MKNLLLYLFIATAFCSCKNTSSNVEIIQAIADTTITVRYAKGFTVSEYNGYRLVDMQDPDGISEQTYHYAFVPKGVVPKDLPTGYTVIETPVRSIICMTSLQLSNFIKLDQLDKIVGITSTRFLFNEEMKKRIEEKKVSQIGIEGNFDAEIIMSLNPDIILVSPFKRGGYEAISDLNIPLVSFLGYKETTPLGQAEWLKFTAMLLGIEEEANELFATIEQRYNELKALAASAEYKPTVMSGEMRSGNWYVVGGKSYLAELFRDAGAEYFLKDNNETGGLTLDFESVYMYGSKADYWRLLVSHTGDYSYDALKSSDTRYTDFKAYKDRKVVCCNLRQKPFYENTPVEPEVVLADLIKAFHPDLLPDYTPVYYEMLNR